MSTNFDQLNLRLDQLETSRDKRIFIRPRRSCSYSNFLYKYADKDRGEYSKKRGQ